MNNGDKVSYLSHGICNGIVLNINDGKAEVTVDSGGWLAKPNKVVPVGQINVANPQVGQYVQYAVTNTVTATVKLVYANAIVVAPDFCPAMEQLIGLEQLTSHLPN